MHKGIEDNTSTDKKLKVASFGKKCIWDYVYKNINTDISSWALGISIKHLEKRECTKIKAKYVVSFLSKKCLTNSNLGQSSLKN